MTDVESLARAIVEPVHLCAYDPDWPRLFLEESKRVSRSVLERSLIAFEHIGSTAVPGLTAKPIIDLMMGVPSIDYLDTILAQLCGNGYTTSAEFNATLGQQRWAMRHSEGRRTHHLHVLLFKSDEWQRRLAFRNILRGRPEIASEYVALKVKLAAALGADREAYTQAKTDFVERVLRRYDPHETESL